MKRPIEILQDAQDHVSNVEDVYCEISAQFAELDEYDKADECTRVAASYGAAWYVIGELINDLEDSAQ